MTEPLVKNPGLRFRSREQRLLLILMDALMAVIALGVGGYVWSVRDPLIEFSLRFWEQRVPSWFAFLPLFWLLMMVELYDPHKARNIRQTLRGIAMAALGGLLLYAVVYLLSPKGSLPRTGVAVFLLAAAILTLVWRLTYIAIFTAPSMMRRVLVIGAGKAGITLAQAYRSLWPPPFYLIGYLDDDPSKVGTQVEGFEVLGTSDDLLTLIDREAVSDLVVAINGEIRGKTFQLILDAQEQGVDVTRMPTMYEELLGRVPIHHLESDWILRSFVDEARVSVFYELVKRLIDVIGALVGLLIFFVTFPFIALAVVLDSGFPVFFAQERLGKGGRPYIMYKYRSMRPDADDKPTGEHDDRVTRVGAFLRKSHLDELPQFWNILRGEMSLVGPRSERPNWVEYYQRQIPFYRARLLVKPGLTGWAQVNYGYVSTDEETAIKLEYDLYYIKHRNLWMDIVILLRTVGQVIGLRGR